MFSLFELSTEHGGMYKGPQELAVSAFQEVDATLFN